MINDYNALKQAKTSKNKNDYKNKRVSTVARKW
jgi:hypothetical protein